ncbi:BnaA09g12690D [Brassica napus]|uniref:BnaA09g12690D protein n=1 Tax=Brassica napus TaxID=3708 RepID=A0A078I7M7_BRANA|nr:BnaA09g12690D [Brassica napus]
MPFSSHTTLSTALIGTASLYFKRICLVNLITL